LTPRFLGEFEVMLDEKNRLPIPAAIRKKLEPEKAMYLVFVKKWPWLYPLSYYDKLMESFQPSLEPTEEEMAFIHKHGSMASIVEWDNQGRVLIPELTLRRCEGLGRELTLVGGINRLEIWNRQAWNTRWTSLLDKGTGNSEAKAPNFEPQGIAVPHFQPPTERVER
jgi:MraZ protein